MYIVRCHKVQNEVLKLGLACTMNPIVYRMRSQCCWPFCTLGCILKLRFLVVLLFWAKNWKLHSLFWVLQNLSELKWRELILTPPQLLLAPTISAKRLNTLPSFPPIIGTHPSFLSSLPFFPHKSLPCVGFFLMFVNTMDHDSFFSSSSFLETQQNFVVL